MLDSMCILCIWVCWAFSPLPKQRAEQAHLLDIECCFNLLAFFSGHFHDCQVTCWYSYSLYCPHGTRAIRQCLLPGKYLHTHTNCCSNNVLVLCHSSSCPGQETSTLHASTCSCRLSCSPHLAVTNLAPENMQDNLVPL